MNERMTSLAGGGKEQVMPIDEQDTDNARSGRYADADRPAGGRETSYIMLSHRVLYREGK